MKINYQLTEEEADLELKLRLHYGKPIAEQQKTGCNPWWVAFILLMVAGITKSFNGIVYSVSLFLSLAIFAIMTYLSLFGKSKNSKEATEEIEASRPTEAREMTLIGDTITTQSEGLFWEYKSQMIKCILKFPNYVFVVYRTGGGHLIPEVEFSDLDDFASWVMQRNIEWVENDTWGTDSLT